MIDLLIIHYKQNIYEANILKATIFCQKKYKKIFAYQKKYLSLDIIVLIVHFKSPN